MKSFKILYSIICVVISINCYAVDFSTYSIDATKCNKLITKSGSVIKIPANAFGSNYSKVDIKYREYHTLEDILRDSISMLSKVGNDLKLLETGGMFEIKAFSDGKELDLQAGAKVEVTFASRKKVENLQVFINENNNWVLTNKSFKNQNAIIDSTGNKPTSGKFNSSILLECDCGDESASEMGLTEKQYQKQENMNNVVFRSLEIDKMGLYNYDRILNENNVLLVDVNFEIKGSKEKFKRKVFCIHSKFNTITYHITGANSPLAYSNDGKLTFFTIIDENTIMKVSESQTLQLKNKVKDNKLTLVLDEVINNEPNKLKTNLKY